MACVNANQAYPFDLATTKYPVRFDRTTHIAEANLVEALRKPCHDELNAYVRRNVVEARHPEEPDTEFVGISVACQGIPTPLNSLSQRRSWNDCAERGADVVARFKDICRRDLWASDGHRYCEVDRKLLFAIGDLVAGNCDSGKNILAKSCSKCLCFGLDLSDTDITADTQLPLISDPTILHVLDPAQVSVKLLLPKHVKRVHRMEDIQDGIEYVSSRPGWSHDSICGSQ